MKTAVLRALFMAACLLAIGSAAEARTQSSSAITGIVTDSAGAPLAGVSVTLQSTSLSEPQTVVTNRQGMYRFWELPRGVYDVSTAELKGQVGKRAALLVSVGTTLTIDLVLGKTSTGAGPMIDVTSSASTTRLSSDDLENLPIGGGVSILELVPGITPRSAFGGDTQGSLVTADDGTISTTGRGNLSAAAIHVYWMEEAQIFGLGAGAEHGEFSAVVANITIRSGSHRTAGLLEYRTTPTSWVGDNTGSLSESLRVKFHPDEVLSRWDTSVQVAGPIGKRLFFFSGGHYERNRTLKAGTVTPLDERSPAFLTKLTWAPRRELRVSGFVEADRTHAFGRLFPNVQPEAANDQTTNMRSWNGQATWILGSSTVVRFQAGGVKFDFTGIPEARRAGPAPHFDRKTRIQSGNINQFQDVSTPRHFARASLTRFLNGAAGRSHTLEAGLEIERSTYRQFTAHPGGQKFTDENGVPLEVELWAGDRVASSTWRTTLFVQDAWSASRRLTVHPGLRVSINRGSVPDKGTVFRTNPVSPRIGVAWDVAADHRTVVRAAYGRIHEWVSPGLFAFMSTSGRTPKITADVIGPNTFVEKNTVTPDRHVAIADDLAHAAVDQYVVGIERELFPDFSLTLQYVKRNFDDIWGFIDTGSRYELVQARDPGPDNAAGTADDGELITVYDLLNRDEGFSELTNPVGASRRYDAVQAIGQKRFADSWQLLAAYTWSSARGNVNAFGNDTSMSGVFFNPNRGINADGRLASDYRHQLTIQGVYLVPAWSGLGLSAGYTYLSGGAAGRTATIKGLTQGDQVVRIEPRGTQRIDGAGVLDVRVEKTFRLRGSGRTIGIYADLLNLTNNGVPLALTILEGSGDTYGEPSSWATPRTVRIAGRVRF